MGMLDQVREAMKMRSEAKRIEAEIKKITAEYSNGGITVIAKTREIYIKAYEDLSGRKLA